MSPEAQTIHRLLEGAADTRGDAVGLVHGEHRWTWHELEERANRLANLLLDRGLAVGDRVGLLADNGPGYVAGYFGILKAGGCVVALNTANRAESHRRLLADAGARALVTEAAQVRRDLPRITAGLPDLQRVLVDRISPQWDLPRQLAVHGAAEVEAASSARPALPLGPGDLATILYTSGSTGVPRGVTLLHRNLAANTRQIRAYLDPQPEDRQLVVLPFHYSYGKSLLLTHAAVGACLVIDNRFAYPSAVVDTMAAQRATTFAGVPSTYAILAARTDFLTRTLPDLRTLTQAGGGMAPALVRRVRDAFAGRARLFVMYGQTEACARLSWVPPERLKEKLGSIGIGIPGVELLVRREDGRECAVDEVGQVVARGENIMRGYWNDPAETSLVLTPEGDLLTGDLGRKDTDGYIFLVDRIKNMIKAGANRVSAKEVEDAIAEVPGVEQVCVVGVPAELLGEAIEAHVVPVPGAGLTEKAILAHLRDTLALFKLPRTVHFRDNLPKNSSGKILKAELKKRK
ncbi:MAG: class I adenylate-forming enzyme family protein [Candidatus Krumholzibacteriia bacterium]